MTKKTLKYALLYVVAGLLAAILFLYLRFPSDIFRDYFIDRVTEIYPGATITLESATLMLTNAPGVTGGQTLLIWEVVFTGHDAEGISAGGWVYIEAYAGQIMQYLVPA